MKLATRILIVVAFVAIALPMGFFSSRWGTRLLLSADMRAISDRLTTIESKLTGLERKTAILSFAQYDVPDEIVSLDAPIFMVAEESLQPEPVPMAVSPEQPKLVEPDRRGVVQLEPPGPPVIEQKPMVSISGPEIARIGDMPTFKAEFVGIEPKLIAWTVDPPVSKMGANTDTLGIATPVTGEYRVHVLAVDAEFRRLEASYTCSIGVNGVDAKPVTMQSLASDWTEFVEPGGLDAAAELQVVLRDLASLLRQDEISSFEQLDQTFEQMLTARLDLDSRLAWQPWFKRFNQQLELEKRKGRLRTIQAFEVFFDRAADGLPVETH